MHSHIHNYQIITGKEPSKVKELHYLICKITCGNYVTN